MPTPTYKLCGTLSQDNARLHSLTRADIRNIIDRLEFLYRNYSDISLTERCASLDRIIDSAVDTHERLVKMVKGGTR